MVEVEVEVVDAPLYYNLFLGCNWTYAMIAIVSYVLHTLYFPYEGNIVMIDQLSTIIDRQPRILVLECFLPLWVLSTS